MQTIDLRGIQTPAEERRNTARHITVILVIGIIASVAYIAYLDAGCRLGGAMTWSGKVCIGML